MKDNNNWIIKMKAARNLLVFSIKYSQKALRIILSFLTQIDKVTKYKNELVNIIKSYKQKFFKENNKNLFLQEIDKFFQESKQLADKNKKLYDSVQFSSFIVMSLHEPRLLKYDDFNDEIV